ncbi:MAG TPA: hypothetical protein VHE77_12390 [Dongiaceae bacterium]|nr:hypothetical protein [Dongiaceae bacterium]
MLRGDASLHSELTDEATPLVLLAEAADNPVILVAERRPAPFIRYWSVLSAAAAGWATLAIAYCPWHLMPQSLHEFGVVLFGAAAGGSGALVMSLHPEEKP